MKIRLYNAKIITMQKNAEILDGEIITDNGLISYIGAESNAKGLFDREIDCMGNLIMPGFKNAHTHSAMTFLRSYADDLPLQEWLFERVFPMEGKLSEDDVYHLTKLAVLEYLSSGITSCFDMYFFPESIAQASIDMGFRTVLCGAVSGDSENVKKLENFYNKFNKMHPLISYQLGFHAEYTAHKALLCEISELAHSLRKPVFAHNSETAREVKECIGRHGTTPTELFDSLGLFDFGGGGFHCVHMSERDLDIFAEKKLWAVTNPGSNTKLASGIAPVCKMQDRGIGLAIGTDGPSSNNCLDMFREMFLVTGLQKLLTNDAAACPANSVLEMATEGGALAMGLTNSDTLAVGKNADLIVINLHRPNMQPINNITKNLVYSGSKENVALTMIDGKILYKDGEFAGCDAEAVYAKANEIINRMK